MKLPKILVTLIAALFLTAGYALAEDKPATAEPKKAACCAKAEKDGKDCGHGCCVKAMEAGKNCEQCGGAGMAEKK